MNTEGTLGRIVMHMDDTGRSSDRLAFASRIARRHGSELSVLYATLPGFALVPWAPEGVVPALELLQDADNERMAAARKTYDRALAEPGLKSTFALCCDMPVESGFVQQALYADLLVMGQRDAGDSNSGWVPADFVEYVLNTTGKPAIVVPHSGKLPQQLDTVAIAWKETPEAARALAASLPFLKQAGRVVALAWGPGEGEARPALVRLAHYLRVHGVEMEGSYQSPESADVGELMLSRCSEMGADLLVMGLYGHSRAREWALGGASRSILRSMTLPVLMAH